MNDEQMRREFEHWAATFKGPHGLPYFTIRKEDGTYVDGCANIAWDGWKAAHQTRASDTVNCPDCTTPLLFECPGCSKMNYPESSRGVDFEALQAFAEELDADVQVGLQSEDGLDRVVASVKRAVIVRLIGIMDNVNQ